MENDDLLDSQYMKIASEILPGHIYVSGIIPASSEFILTTLKIKRIISLTHSEIPRHEGIEYLHIKIHDEPDEDITSHIDTCHAFIENGAKENVSTLIHCNMGVSRSVTIVLSFLIAKHGHSLKSAFDFVRERRPIISPNFGFLRQLAKYESKIHGRPESLEVIVQRLRELWDLSEDEFSDDALEKALIKAGFNPEKLAYELYPTN